MSSDAPTSRRRRVARKRTRGSESGRHGRGPAAEGRSGVRAGVQEREDRSARARRSDFWIRFVSRDGHLPRLHRDVRAVRVTVTTSSTHLILLPSHRGGTPTRPRATPPSTPPLAEGGAGRRAKAFDHSRRTPRRAGSRPSPPRRVFSRRIRGRRLRRRWRRLGARGASTAPPRSRRSRHGRHRPPPASPSGRAPPGRLRVCLFVC